MANHTVAVINDALKRIQTGDLADAIYKKSGYVMGIAKKDRRGFGREINRPVRTKSVYSMRGVNESGDMPTPDTNTYDQFAVTPTTQYATGSFTGQAMRRSSGDMQSWLTNIMTEVVDTITDSFKGSIARQMFNLNSSGKMAEVYAVDANTTTVYLKTHFDTGALNNPAQQVSGEYGIQFLASGMGVVFLPAGGGSEVFQSIQSVDTETQSIEVNSNVGIAVGDIVILGESTTLNTFEKEIFGLDAIAARDNTYFGINRSGNQNLNSILMNAVSGNATQIGPFQRLKLQSLLNNVETKAMESVKMCITRNEVMDEIFQSMGEANQRFGETRFEFGYKIIKYGICEFAIDPCAPPGKIYAAPDWKDIELILSPSAEFAPVNKDNPITQIYGSNNIGKDAWVYATLWEGQMFSQKPWKFGVYRNIELSLDVPEYNN